MEHKLPDYLAQLPKFGERVMVLHADGIVECVRFSAALTAPLSDGTWPWRLCAFGLESEKQPTHWANLPDTSCLNWIIGRPDGSRLKEGEQFLAMNHDGYVCFRNWTTKPLPFPGFWGGENVRYEKVAAWMKFSEKDFFWHITPDEIRTLPSYSEWQRAERARWCLRRSSEIALAAINDGELYRQHWQAFANGQTLRRGKYTFQVQDLIPGEPKRKLKTDYWMDRENLARGWARSAILTLTNRPEFRALYEEEDAGDGRHGVDWGRAATIAAQEVLDYYKQHYLDSKRANEAA